jgi:hypothetical protein
MRKVYTEQFPHRRVCQRKTHNNEAAFSGLYTAWRNKLRLRPVVHRYVYTGYSHFCRTGIADRRQQAIDENEITCPLPTAGDTGSALSLAYCHSLIRISKVSSKIEKRLSAVRCVEQGPAVTIQTIAQFDTELADVKQSLRKSFGLALGDRITALPPPGGLTTEQLLYIQYAYMTAILSIHTVLAYPWMRALIGVRSPNQFRDAIAQSVAAVIKCSREAILLTEYIHFTAQTTVP